VKQLAAVRKAVAGAVVPAVVALVYASLPASSSGTAVTGLEWALVAVAGLSSGSAVYWIRNGRQLEHVG
jgi:hypothetical protein